VSDTPLQHFHSEGSEASYSAAVRVGDLIWTCGQLGAEPGGPAVDFETQAEAALKRLVAVVEEAGGSVETIVKINGYLASMSDFAAYDRIYRSVIAAQPMPARTTVQIGGFVEPLLVEVDAIAVAQQ
jgi:2-iminobutanoate/2-iminopropanoate deaminase